MKIKIMYAAILCSFFVACNSHDKSDKEDQDDGSGKNLTVREAKEEKKISKRDFSITPENAYNDLFLDTAILENFISQKKPGDILANRMRSFYNTRNFQFAWLASDGLTEQALGFWNLHDYYSTYSGDTSLNDKSLNYRMNELMLDDDPKISAADKSMINTELTLTLHFIQYSLKNFKKGYVKRKELERFVPAKKQDAMLLADSLLTKKHKDDKYFGDVNPAYQLLKNELAKYYSIAKKGGWEPVSTDKKIYKKNNSSPLIAALKKRLQLTGDMPGADTSQLFDDALETGIKNFQVRHGYKPTGLISDALIKDMNVPVLQRLQQLLINMDLARWMPTKPPGNLIIVNIPEFVLHATEGGKKIFDMIVVVGKEGHNTTLFTGDLNQVVFSPYWNVPSSIVRKEILPGMQRNKNYLASHHMEIIGHNGSLPVIRQLPGPANSLGKVKFLFPNSFDIYFHDTPSKGLFSQDKRAYSHGCIRLSDPEKMANYLLRNDPAWSPEKIHEAMNSGKEKYVRLKESVPVLISYYTAWVSDEGQLNFRGDVYGHDKKIQKKMFIENDQSMVYNQ